MSDDVDADVDVAVLDSPRKSNERLVLTTLVVGGVREITDRQARTHCRNEEEVDDAAMI